jgi:hypothetical protein
MSKITHIIAEKINRDFESISMKYINLIIENDIEIIDTPERFLPFLSFRVVDDHKRYFIFERNFYMPDHFGLSVVLKSGKRPILTLSLECKEISDKINSLIKKGR